MKMPALSASSAPTHSAVSLLSGAQVEHTAVEGQKAVKIGAEVETKAGAGARAVADSDVDTNGDTCQPEATTSPSLFSRLVSQPLLEAKDRRAYEVARQRAKHPQDRRKTRIQKAKLGHGLFAGARDGRSTLRRVDDREKEEEPDIYGYGCPKMACDAVFVNKSKSSSTPEKPEVVVHLEDLIRAAKVRKTKAGDFEVIPHVRAVIALDEAEFGGIDDESKVPRPKGSVSVPDFVDGEEEDWEHVDSESTATKSSSDGEEQSKAPSYAQVVSCAQQ